jgi:phospholipid-binding lipoprotein MlaA
MSFNRLKLYPLHIRVMLTGVAIIFSIMICSNSSANVTKEMDADLLDDDSFNSEDQSYETSSEEVYDPLEKMNRGIFAFNHQLDRFLIRPITLGYRHVVPQPGRKAVHNMLRNLGEPITFLNAGFQGNPGGAFSALGRFMINSSFGIAGLLDITKSDADRHDFGETLGHYHTGPGPYLVLPILGPSNIRDGVGLVADTFSDPFYYLLNPYQNLGRSFAKGLDKRESVLNLTDEINRTSLDPYATYRSLYSQHRQSKIKSPQ